MGAKKLAVNFFVHPTAVVSPKAKIGKGTKIWAFAQIRENVVIGQDCVIGNGVYIDSNVKIGDRVNIHNKALLYRNLVVEDEVFIGPGACFTNDACPRANRIRVLGQSTSRVKRGASIGANCTILPDLTIGSYAMVGAGSVVTKSVKDYAVIYGIRASERGRVSQHGKK